MTDKTATTKRAELAREGDEARVEERRLRQQAQDVEDRTAKLRQRLAERPAAEFSDDGQPNAKTEAKRIADEITTATGAAWSERIKAAEQATRRARAAVDRFTHDNIVELAAERRADDHQSVADLDALFEELERAARNIISRAASWSELLRTVPGLDLQRELPPYDNLAGLLKVIRQHRGTIRQPVPKSIDPQPGEVAPRVRTDQGWVAPDAAERAERRVRERVEAQERQARRAERISNVEFKFGPDEQPPPDATPLERTLHGLLG